MKQLEVVVPLMHAFVFRHRNGIGQEKTATIPVIANPAWDTGNPCQRGRLESVLQQKRGIESFRAQLSGESKFAAQIVPALSGFIQKDFVRNRLPSVDISHPGSRKNRNIRLRKARP